MKCLEKVARWYSVVFYDLFYSLDFTFNPPSSVYGYDQVELKPSGADIIVTIENIEEYIELVSEFCMGSGIRLQLDAFRGKTHRLLFFID